MLLRAAAGPPPQALQRRAPGLLREVLPGAAALEPTHVLSNGRYSVVAARQRRRLEPLGQRRHHALARRRAARRATAASSTCAGTSSRAPVSITQHPAPDPAAHYRSTFHADRVCFDAAWPELQAHTTVWVSPEDDIEFRQVELRNLSDRTLDIELISAFEVTLADAARRRSAPGVLEPVRARRSGSAAHQALVFERKPRLATERGAAGGALPRRHRPAGDRPARADRPPALAGPQPRRRASRWPRSSRCRRPPPSGERRPRARTPASTRSARWPCACASRRTARRS